LDWTELGQGGFERILVAVDGSGSSLSACEAVASLAAGFEADVTLLNVIPSGGIRRARQSEEVKAKLEEGSEKELEKAAAPFEGKGLSVSRETLHAKPSVAQSILDCAARKKCDLIGLGTRRLGGFQGMLLGSISNGVATHASCSVLVVRRGPSSKTAAFRKILVAVDGSANSRKAAKKAGEIAKAMGSELVVIHIIHIPGYAYDAAAGAATNTLENDARDYGRKLLQDTSSEFKRAGVTAKLELIEEIQSPSVRIARYAKEIGTDLVVIGARGVGGFERLLLGSVAIGVLHYSHCSVMVVR